MNVAGFAPGFDPDQVQTVSARRYFDPTKMGEAMPFDAMMLSLAVLVVFLGFAVALAWADSQTNTPAQPKTNPQKRRSF
jgi:hypothetical protein